MTQKKSGRQTVRPWPGRPRRSPWMGIAISLVSLALLVAVALLAGRSNPQVTEIITATALDDGFEAVTPTDTFQPEDTFFASVKISGYRSDQDIRALWRLNGDRLGETPLETHGTAGSITAGFSLSSSSPWPAGHYTVEIVFEEQILGSADFQVEP